MNGLLSTLGEMGAPLAIAALAFVLSAILQVIRRYTLPNIGYYKRKHGRDETFLIRNLDSTHYNQKLSVVVSGQDLEYVAVQAGPWCQVDLKGQTPPLRVDFTGVPEDAVFIIRARARVGEVHLRMHADSELKSRHSFETPIDNFTVYRRFTYYALRYAFGLAMFLLVFLGSIAAHGMPAAEFGVLEGDPFTTGDYSVCVLGAVVSVLSFFLVVPFKGKRTFGGYDGGPIDQGQHACALGSCWPDAATVVAAFDSSLGIGRKNGR